MVIKGCCQKIYYLLHTRMYNNINNRTEHNIAKNSMISILITIWTYLINAFIDLIRGRPLITWGVFWNFLKWDFEMRSSLPWMPHVINGCPLNIISISGCRNFNKAKYKYNQVYLQKNICQGHLGNKHLTSLII